MKKIAIALAALAVMAAAASAAVYSQNAVGFINVTIGENEFVPLTIPFDVLGSEEGSILFRDTQIAKDAKRGSVAYFWRNQKWVPANAGPKGFTTDERLQPGECFFFKPSNAMTFTLNGEVPSDDKITVTLLEAENFSAVGNPYPVDMPFKDTAIAKSAQRGAQAFFWKDGRWNPVTAGPSGFTTDAVLKAGEGIFFKSTKKDTATIYAEETKPYVYP